MFAPRVCLREQESLDDLQMQLDDVSQHLQLLRSRVSSWASAHAQWENKSRVRVVVVHFLG